MCRAVKINMERKREREKWSFDDSDDSDGWYGDEDFYHSSEHLGYDEPYF